MLRNVYFEGDMGDRFLPRLQIDCETPADVFRCMDANFPDFKQYLIQKHEEDTRFDIQVGNDYLEYPEECLMEIGDQDIIITPVPAGSGKSFGKILAAIAIVIITVKTFGTGGTFMAKLTSAAGTFGGKVGLAVAGSLAMTGLAEMMAPDPSVDADMEMDQSYLFDGNQDAVTLGNPVPLVYGKMRVPGQPISFEVQGHTTMGGAIALAGGETSTRKTSSYFEAHTEKEVTILDT